MSKPVFWEERGFNLAKIACKRHAFPIYFQSESNRFHDLICTNLRRLFMRRKAFVRDSNNPWRLGILLSLALFAFTSITFAQGGGNVAITGTVTDPSGAVVVGAQVKITQKNTSIIRTSTTNSSGQFNFPALPPATYTLSVQSQGFKQYVQDVIMLADQVRNMDVHLQVGETTQQLTVEASSVQVNTVSPVLG